MAAADEIAFVESFVTKAKRDRYKTKLAASKEKRHGFLGCLDHWRDVDERFVQWLPSNASLVDLLKQHGAPDICAVISPVTELDGREMELMAAINAVTGSGCGAILSCISGKLAVYLGEDGESRAILIRNR
jgi:hypothetical protein